MSIENYELSSIARDCPSPQPHRSGISKDNAMTFAITRKSLFDYNAPKDYAYSLLEIVESLHNQTRFMGHRNISVLGHSLGMANYARKRGYSPRVQFGCLIHDFAEAYTTDIPTPLRNYLESRCPSFSAALAALSSDITSAMREQFKWPTLQADEELEVKRLDKMALWHEAVHKCHLDGKFGCCANDFIDVYQEIYREVAP